MPRGSRFVAGRPSDSHRAATGRPSGGRLAGPVVRRAADPAGRRAGAACAEHRRCRAVPSIRSTPRNSVRVRRHCQGRRGALRGEDSVPGGSPFSRMISGSADQQIGREEAGMPVRGRFSRATGAAAVLVFALSGCAGEGDGKNPGATERTRPPPPAPAGASAPPAPGPAPRTPRPPPPRTPPRPRPPPRAGRPQRRRTPRTNTPRPRTPRPRPAARRARRPLPRPPPAPPGPAGAAPRGSAGPHPARGSTRCREPGTSRTASGAGPSPSPSTAAPTRCRASGHAAPEPSAAACGSAAEAAGAGR